MSYTHDQQPENLSNELFGEVISTYTDAQAVEDLFLAAIAGPRNVNRVTRAVFDYFTQSMGPGVINIIGLTQAIRHMIAQPLDDGWRKGQGRGKVLWLIPIDVSGFTLMFPEDY
jgi:hypothetical protein